MFPLPIPLIITQEEAKRWTHPEMAILSDQSVLPGRDKVDKVRNNFQMIFLKMPSTSQWCQQLEDDKDCECTLNNMISRLFFFFCGI